MAHLITTKKKQKKKQTNKSYLEADVFPLIAEL